MTENVGSGMVIGEGLKVSETIIPSIVNRTFRNFMNNYKIEHIDFLKIDCECCEYFVFTEDNKDLLEKINVISGEVHVANDIFVGPENTYISKDDIVKTLDILEEMFDVTYTSLDNFIIPNVREKLDYYRQFLIYATNKKLKNKLILEYNNGYVKVESEKFDQKNPKMLYFIDEETKETKYTSEITNSSQWSKSTIKAKKWKINLGEYSVTISEDNPKKILTY